MRQRSAKPDKQIRSLILGEYASTRTGLDRKTGRAFVAAVLLVICRPVEVAPADRGDGRRMGASISFPSSNSVAACVAAIWIPCVSVATNG